MAELKPCPFCGGDAAVNTIRYEAGSEIAKLNKQSMFYGVNCISCGTNNLGLVGHKTEDSAIAAWNRRATAGQRAEPVAWVEAETSARDSDVRTVMRGHAYSTRWHWQAERPATRNPVWPIFADGQRAGVPEGYVLVPAEPTPEMVDAGWQHTADPCWSEDVANAYRAMLAAVPTPPAGDAGPFAGVSKVERESDFSVRLTFDSCRQASAFDRAAMAAMAASKGEKG